MNGMFFLVDRNNKPIPLRLDGALAVPVFSGPQQIADAERWFNLPRGRPLEITNGNRFYEVFHHDFLIVMDPRVVDGQCLYDAVQVDPDPKELS